MTRPVTKIMARSLKFALLLLLPLTPFTQSAYSQASPAAVGAAPYQGFELPKVNGSLQYAVSASETVTTGYYRSNGGNGIGSSTNISGDLAYLSSSAARPFSLVYSGGYLGGTGGQSSAVFQNLAASQVLNTRHFNFVVSDSVSYLPDAPTTGLSGIAGVGDLGIPPIQLGPDPGQGVLTGNATRLTNVASVGAERKLTGKTSLQGSGSLYSERFIGTSSRGGLDSNQVTGSIGPNHRIDARNQIFANYTYSRFTYSAYQFGFTTQTANLGYSRQWNREYSSSISLGPQRTSSSNSALSQPSLNLAANAGVTYTGRTSSSSLSYFRGVNNGSGVIQGAHSDSVQFGSRRMLSRIWNGAVTASYTRTSNLPFLNSPAFTSNTLVAGAQVSRSISRSFFAYASYTVQKQSTKGFGATFNIFSGLSQVIGVGLTYSPASKHFGRL